MSITEMDALAELLPRVLKEAMAYREGLDQPPVRAVATDPELHALLDNGLPDAGSTPMAVIERLLNASGGLVSSGNGQYFGYVVGGTLPVALAADWLTSAWDQCCAVHDMSPLTAVLEEISGRWLVELFGLPAGTSVAFTPACTHADLLGLTAARHKVLTDHGWDVARQGLVGAPSITVLVNDAVHAAVIRSLQLLGLGGSVRRLPTDSEGRIEADELAKELERAGDGPLIVCGHVGEIHTGGVDRLRELCNRVHAKGGWVHLDAAFGLWAAAHPGLRASLLDGLELADSWAADAHKWLNVPYDCGMAFIADPEAHRAAVPLTAEYLHLEEGKRHPVEWGLEVSRRSRVIPLWAALSQLGRRGIAELIGNSCAHAVRFANRLCGHPGVRVVNSVALNQVLVRFEHPERGTNEHTRDVAELFKQQGFGWAGVSEWKGNSVLRLSVSNWATTEADIDAAADTLIACHTKQTHRAPSRPGLRGDEQCE